MTSTETENEGLILCEFCLEREDNREYNTDSELLCSEEAPIKYFSSRHSADFSAKILLQQRQEHQQQQRRRWDTTSTTTWTLEICLHRQRLDCTVPSERSKCRRRKGIVTLTSWVLIEPTEYLTKSTQYVNIKSGQGNIIFFFFASHALFDR